MLYMIKGLVAGLIATLVLSALMMIKSAMGIMPELNVIAILSEMGHQLMGLDQTPMTGWILHFLIGTIIWGGLFALIAGILPGSTYWQKGIIFGIIGWFLMMVLIMPVANADMFGLALGIMAPVMTLILHVIFGAVMGAVYQNLPR